MLCRGVQGLRHLRAVQGSAGAVAFACCAGECRGGDICVLHEAWQQLNRIVCRQK